MAQETRRTTLRLNTPRTILMGFGFLAASLAWAVYDPYVTKLLDQFLSQSAVIAGWSARLAHVSFFTKFIESQGEEATVGGRFTIAPLVIGILMTFDNLFGVIFQPWFGRLSDRHRSRLGKRRPFIFFAAPISAVLFALIPRMPSLSLLVVCLILFVFFMSLWRSPVVALMPDLTPPELHSDGNAIINLMGGFGAVLGMSAGAILTLFFAKQRGILPSALGEFTTFPGVFLFGGIVMLLSCVILLFVKEPSTQTLQNTPQRQKERNRTGTLESGKRASLFLMLGGLFFLFCGTNAITTFFSLFAQEILHQETARAGVLMVLFALCSAAAALPAGKLGRRFGRKRMILVGLLLFFVAFGVFFGSCFFAAHAQNLSLSGFTRLNQLQPMSSEVLAVTRVLNTLIYPVMVVAGAAHMLITVNTLPLVLEIGGRERIGAFTGYYYTATFSAQIASPIVYGFFRIFSGSYLSLFYYSPIAFALSFLCVFFVRHGEALPQELLDLAEQS